MADPASVLALVSASLTITFRAAAIGKYLHSLRSRFQRADQTIRQLSVHISAIRVAARSLSSWLKEDGVGSIETEELKGNLLEVLSACCELLFDLQKHVTSTLFSTGRVGIRGAASYLWNEDVIREVTQTLHQQEVALLLILQTLMHTRKAEQPLKLDEPANAETFVRAKRPSSSIFKPCGERSSSLCNSEVLENSENLDIKFSFDAEIMASMAYRECFADLVRQRLRQEREPEMPSEERSPPRVTTGCLSPWDKEQEKMLDLKEASFWVPKASLDGKLSYFNTLTGQSSMVLPG